MINQTIPAKGGGLYKMSREDFLRFYTNRPMERVAGLVYDYFADVRKKNLLYQALESVYNEILLNIGGVGMMLDFLEDLQEPGHITERYPLMDSNVWRELSIVIKNHLFERIDNLFEKAKGYIEWGQREPELMPVFQTWVSCIDQLPAPEDILVESDGYIPWVELNEINELFNFTLDSIEDAFEVTREEVEVNFLPFVLSTGVTLNNSMYRDIYDCMKMASLIRAEQVRSHDSSTSRYVRENYIKLKIKRLLEK